MKIKALAPWYGSKRTLGPRIVRELGAHKFYVEPFCGSLAVLLAKPPVNMETVNDLHVDLINLARVLANETAAEVLYRLASRVLMHDDLHAEFKAVCVEGAELLAPSVREVAQIHIDRALAYLVMSWMGRNGSAGTKPTNITTARRFTSNGGSGGMRWQSAVESIPDWHERLRKVVMSRMDAFELLERLGDQERTVIYVDPPYLRKSTKYVHDLAAADHQRLCETLGRFKRARVVVSYYDEPELREMYKGWTFVPCPMTKGLVNQGKRDSDGEAVAAPEILIINGPAYTADADGLWVGQQREAGVA